ncbi:uncharacterized protein N7525_006305 [Penicillium rubens]|jgi:hypothetical protein|uniref:uncharacterized protein n=1 Tax=Penicillium rubens TaxID=1108849 RepID=UPI002A5B0F93|nr:uncharacterized protein N7525_006305 [Penicillium rubens]KAJ5828052.1 hypothetical protein N7525_006305 [Penicillium rubens]
MGIGQEDTTAIAGEGGTQSQTTTVATPKNQVDQDTQMPGDRGSTTKGITAGFMISPRHQVYPLRRLVMRATSDANEEEGGWEQAVMDTRRRGGRICGLHET